MIMKKFSLYLGLALGIFFASCSNDDYAEELQQDTEAAKLNPNGALVKKIITTSDSGTLVSNDDYVYSGSKLVRVNSSNGGYVAYTYSGNLITQRDFYYNGAFNTREIFTYNANNKLTGYVRKNASNATIYQTVFTYNSDGTISVKGYRGATIGTGSEIVSRKVFLVNGKVNKIETYSTTNGATTTDVNTYTFDNKKSPFGSIIGFDKLTYYDLALNGSANNVTKIVKGSSEVDNAQYTYNALNYPMTVVRGGFTSEYLY